MDSLHDKPALHVPLFEESVVDFWESISRDWPNAKYDLRLVDDLDDLLHRFASESGKSVERVLDCGCGAGNPSIGLAKKGYEIYCMDADPNMVDRFRENCSEAEVEIPVIQCDWRDLDQSEFEGHLFDAAICRGNSLIYAGCWDRPAFIPEVAKRAVFRALEQIAATIRPGGLFYVDITSSKEYVDDAPKFEFVGRRETETHDVVMYWVAEYDPERRTRLVHGRRVFEAKVDHRPEYMTAYTFVSYMLYHSELTDFAKRVGLVPYHMEDKMPSEWLYDVFLFQKR